MQKIEVEYSRVPNISSKDLHYIQLSPFLQKHIAFTPKIESFAKAINNRKSIPTDRSLLVDVLTKQYKNTSTTEATRHNIELLSQENTYTIVTAHQPSLFTGPLYYIYKTASVINLCKKLEAAYPDCNFVPVFVSGGEDHDFEEINHVRLYGKEITWQSDQKGSVGRMNIDGIEECLTQLSDILGQGKNSAEIQSIISDAVAQSEKYGDINKHILNTLFGTYGLLILSMDDRSMKQAFAPILKKEILERPSENLIIETQNELGRHGFGAQAFPRNINLFYISDYGRNRITYEDGKYSVVDTPYTFTEEEILTLLDEHPERFSPNVVMRPIYQEYILPNLAYVGGGGEIAYWLERKSQFEHFGVPYPILVRRNSVKLIDGSAQKKLNKLGMDVTDVLQETHEIINRFLQQNTSVDIHLDAERKILENLWNAIAEKAATVDPTLSKSCLSELAKHQKSIDSIESRIRRKLKADQDVSVKRIESLKAQLFPDNNLQERKENIWQYYNQYGSELIQYLVDHLDPLNKKFIIVSL